EDLAAQGYSVKIIAEDGYAINFESASVAKNDGIIVANTLNGTELPETIGEKNKLCWPLQLIGPDVSAGQKIGGIAAIELIGLAEPSDEWEITLAGAFNRTLTQAVFEDGVACHGKSYTDGSDQVWTGIPLWYLVAVVDDMEADDHWTLNDTRAAAGYTVRVSAADGFSATFNSADIARNDTFLIADKMNAAPLTDDGKTWPLKLVGPSLTNKQKIGSIASITLEGLPDESTESEWTLAVEGPKVADLLTREEFEACGYHTKTYNDGVSTWTGVPLKVLCGWVDDDVMHGSGAFNTALAEIGYTVIVSSGGENPYSKEFSSQEIMANSLDYIVASTVNGTPITGDAYPLRLVGEGAAGSNSVGNVHKIQLVDFQEPTEAPSIRIVRYASDGVTVVEETMKTITWMEENLEVYGAPDGVRLRFQGPTFDPEDLWNPAEDINPGKVDEVVKGTSIKDLCDLVGGAVEGGEVKLVASDGFKATINYTNLYTPLDRQGEAIVAWWTERQGYSPAYSDGPRLFYNAPDGIFGADDMRVCLAQGYWHYYSSGGIQYPSAAGVSNRNIATIEIYQAPREDWNLVLKGAIDTTITRSFFESGKACAMAGHDATWTDDQDQVWSGMPLWLLCGWVDDANSHDAGTDPFNDDLADAGYNVTVIDYGPDGTKGTDDDFSTTFNSSFIARNNNIIVADEIDGAPLPADGDKAPWPLKLVGTALTSNKQKVGSIDEIVLDGVPIVVEPPTGDATISLEEGWNFVSTPKRLADGSNTFAVFFDAVDTADHSILVYDGLEQKWEDIASTEPFLPLDGVWVYANEACTVPLTFAPAGPELPPTKNLGEGWNAIGFSDTVPESAATTLLSLGDRWITLIGYDAENQEYEVSIIRGASERHGDERTMEPMQGYWVYMTGADTLAAIGA
ncbi:MAG: molybdopterin-dependent oxidoreductase, partial [Methanoculleus sp.]